MNVQFVGSEAIYESAFILPVVIVPLAEMPNTELDSIFTAFFPVVPGLTSSVGNTCCVLFTMLAKLPVALMM